MQHAEDIWASEAVASGMQVLDLRRLGDTSFEADSLPMPGGRAYGGQVLAQALLAAGHTVDDERHMHSMHGYFLRPGDASRPITFEVEVLRDGRSFSARRTHAFQDGKPILSMIASFQLPQEGPEHQVTMPEVPRPDEVVSGLDILAPFEGDARADYWLKRTPFDLRHIEGSLLFRPDKSPKQYQTTWVRLREPIEASDLTHRALLAFGCDQVMLEPLLRRHGASWMTPGLNFASLDHAMWWHRPARADEWLLYLQDAPTAQGGRGLGGTWIFSEDGRLVASAAQEGMFRLPLDD
ncbi:acyl-CoA thioesterase II [Demequina sp. NBRC 110057]|uniref:acyl-CoA thioesterase n=1 Tax=Demequina sp. NBRC 110057 TaxID=1570346 RepID=UPI0009FC91BD|nr:acyl-CoA thioesterase II [Demequina sp. NBRC 110057]